MFCSLTNREHPLSPTLRKTKIKRQPTGAAVHSMDEPAGEHAAVSSPPYYSQFSIYFWGGEAQLHRRLLSIITIHDTGGIYRKRERRARECPSASAHRVENPGPQRWDISTRTARAQAAMGKGTEGLSMERRLWSRR